MVPSSYTMAHHARNGPLPAETQVAGFLLSSRTWTRHRPFHTIVATGGRRACHPHAVGPYPSAASDQKSRPPHRGLNFATCPMAAEN